MSNAGHVEPLQRARKLLKMGRAPCCDGNGLKKGPWTSEEDEKLIQYIHKHGHRCWKTLPKLAGLNRCGKSCRLRWTNYLRPGIKRGKFTPEEEHIIIHLHSTLGNKWSSIAAHLPGRTDNDVKNFWNSRLKKKLSTMNKGVDPMTHKTMPPLESSATLPVLHDQFAITSVKDHIVESQSWGGDHAARLQSEVVKLAELQYFLRSLLQSSAATVLTSSMNCFSSIASAMDQTMSGTLLNSQVPIPKPESITSAPPSTLPVLFNSQTDHLPWPMSTYSTVEQPFMGNGTMEEMSDIQRSTRPPPSGYFSSDGKGVDCSSSSYGGVIDPCFWTELSSPSLPPTSNTTAPSFWTGLLDDDPLYD